MEMTSVLWHFLIGMLVSFIGSIPLGSINLSVFQITMNRGTKSGLLFSAGATFVELFYSYIAIRFSAFLLANRDVEFYIQVVAIPAFILLSFYSFRKKRTVSDTLEVKKSTGKNDFIEGFLIGLVNPLQIPFWVAYGTYMLSNDWIVNDAFYLNFFIGGIICGSFLFLSLVVFACQKIERNLNLSRFNMDKIIGIIFLVLAVFQSVKLVI
jgi:threonine/homoserine/homoserine lactone efflux protein